MKFICSSCGACCLSAGRLNGSEYGLPIKEDGSCANLVGSKCSIYEDRPDICRVDKMMFNFDNLSRKDYYKKANKSCNILIDELGIDPKYKINTEDYEI